MGLPDGGMFGHRDRTADPGQRLVGDGGVTHGDTDRPGLDTEPSTESVFAIHDSDTDGRR